MTDKELQRLSRAELLELLIKQTEENEQLKRQLESADTKLRERNIDMENVGSIAEASLKLNGVFEAAENAARQYLENIDSINSKTEEKCDKLICEAHSRADEILKSASEESEKIRSKAEAYWRAVVERANVILTNQDALRSTIQSALSTPVEEKDGE